MKLQVRYAIHTHTLFNMHVKMPNYQRTSVHLGTAQDYATCYSLGNPELHGDGTRRFSGCFLSVPKLDYFPMMIGWNRKHYGEEWKAKGRVEECEEEANRKKREYKKKRCPGKMSKQKCSQHRKRCVCACV